MTMIPLLALAGVVIAIVVGSVWHMPGTPTGKIHMRYIGFDKLSPEEQQRMIDQAKPHMWKTYALQSILSLLTALSVVVIVTMSVQNGVPFSMALGFVLFNWLCFMVPVIGGNILWGNVDRAIAWPKFFSDISYNLITVFLIAIMVSFFI